MDESQERFWCPKCKTWHQGAGADLAFELAPFSPRLELDGSLDIGRDWLLRYWHMECGTRVEFHSMPQWNEAAQDYLMQGAWLTAIDLGSPEGQEDPDFDSGQTYVDDELPLELQQSHESMRALLVRTLELGGHK